MGAHSASRNKATDGTYGARHRVRQHRRIEPYAWLGAGAVTLGIGAAALAGSGVAYADDTSSDSASASTNAQSSKSGSPNGTSANSGGDRDTTDNGDADARSADGDDESEPAHQLDDDNSPPISLRNAENRQLTKSPAFGDKGERLETVLAPAASASWDEPLFREPSAIPSPMPVERLRVKRNLSAVDAAPRLAQADATKLGESPQDLSDAALATVDPPTVSHSAGLESHVESAQTLTAAAVEQTPTVELPTPNTSMPTFGAQMATLSGERSAAPLAAQSLDPRITGTFPVHANPYLMTISPDGRYVYASNLIDSAGTSGVSILDTASNTVKFYTSLNGSVYDVAAGPNGNVYVLANKSAAVLTILNPTLTRTLGTVAIPGGPGTSVSISPNGKTAVVGGFGGALSMINIATRKVTKTVNVGSWVYGAVVSPDNKTVWVNTQGGSGVATIDLSTGAITKVELPSDITNVGSVAISPNGSTVYVGGSKVAIIDAASRRFTSAIDVLPVNRAVVSRLLVTANGKFLIASERGDQELAVIDLSTKSVTKLFSLGGSDVFGMALSPDGTRVYAAEFDRSTLVAISTGLSPFEAATSAGSPNATTGVVTGKVIVTNPANTKLVFKVSAAAKGRVSITTGGTFTYTPYSAARHAASAATASEADKTDSFTVTISGGPNGTITGMVMVQVGPKNTAPKATPSAGTTNTATGVVTGKVTASDADRDPLTFATPSNTAKGSVSIDANGRYTYTPTDAARFAAGVKNASAAAKGDSFTVTVNDGHGGTTTIAVAVKVTPQQLTPTAENLFKAMDPSTHDKLTAQLVRSSGGINRMVVYMTGVDGNAWNGLTGGSLKDGRDGAVGWLNPKVSSFIDDAYDAWTTQKATPTEIMLVGFSGGGQQMQNYAANGKYKGLVKTMVLFGSPLTKKLSEIGVTQGGVKSALLITDLGDQVWTRWTRATPCGVVGVDCADNTSAEDSYNASNADKGTIYWAGNISATDTHGQGAYMAAAKEFDAFVAKPHAASYYRNPYKDWQRFAGTIVSTRISKTH